MELTKKNCEQALKDWTFEVMRNHNNILFDSQSKKHVLKSRFQRQHDLLEHLIKEHFDFLERNKHNNKTLLECDKSELLDCIKVLCYRIDELNSNKPLKLEEIEDLVDKPIWDNKVFQWGILCKTYNDEESNILGINYANHECISFQFVEYEENRFYRKEVKE